MLRVLIFAVAGLFGGFLVPLLLIHAFRWITLSTTGAEADVTFPFTYAPETLALLCTIALPVIDVIVRAQRSRRSAPENRPGGGDVPDATVDGSRR